jgi:peptidoglycan/xylan/chitin deacetylase (PgdA/CDA1 family)
MNKIAFIYENIEFKDKIEYSINTILMNYNIEYSIFNQSDIRFDKKKYEVVIYYGKNDEKIYSDINIIESKLFTEYYLKAESLPEKVQYLNTLPVFFYDSKYDFFESTKNGKLIVNNDIIQTVFYFLTCYEDYVINDYDKYGRANIEKSILYKSNLLSIPVVNKTIQYFIDLLNKKFNLNISIKSLWDDKNFAAVLSHDVDSISKFLPLAKELRLQLSMLLGDKKPHLFYKRLYEYIDKKINKSYEDPFDTFDYILNLEKEYNFKSSFYFMTDNKTYKTTDNLTKSILNKVKKYNCEIGFHPGLGTSNNKEEFNRQSKLFKKDMKTDSQFGIRQHYLSFISGSTWEIHNDAGAMYDTSICYPQVAGFKAGYCLPYKVYSLSKNKILDLWEVPLIVMEGTLLQYMKLNLQVAKKYCIDLLNEIERYKGVFVLLWHNSALCDEFDPHARALFEWMYKELAKRNCITDSASNIISRFALRKGGD